MRKIKMQYPLRNNNQNYDGKIHEILIEEMYQIGDKPLYLMNYYDKTLEQSMCTILNKKNGSFYKMPLNDYTNLGDKIRKYGLKRINDDIVTPFVQLGSFVDIEKLLSYNYDTNRYMVKLQHKSNNDRNIPPRTNNSSNNMINTNINYKVNSNIPNIKNNNIFDKNRTVGPKTINLYLCYNSNNKLVTFISKNTENFETENNNIFGFLAMENVYENLFVPEINKAMKLVNTKKVTNVKSTIVIDNERYTLVTHCIPYFNNLLDETLSNIKYLKITGPVGIQSAEYALHSLINNADDRYIATSIKYNEEYSKQKRK